MTASSEGGQPAGIQLNLDRVDWEALKRDIQRILTEGPNEEDMALAREMEAKYPTRSLAATDGPHSIILTNTEWVRPRKATQPSPNPPRLARSVKGSPRAQS